MPTSNKTILTREEWLHSQNPFTMLGDAEALIKLLKLYKQVLQDQLLLNEVYSDPNGTPSPDYKKLSLYFDISREFMGENSLHMKSGSNLSYKVIELLIEENMKKLNKIRALLPDIPLVVVEDLLK